MEPIFRILIIGIFLLFWHKVMAEFPQQTGSFLAALTQLLPSYQGKLADVKSMGFIAMFFALVLGLAIVILR